MFRCVWYNFRHNPEVNQTV